MYIRMHPCVCASIYLCVCAKRTIYRTKNEDDGSTGQLSVTAPIPSTTLAALGPHTVVSRLSTEEYRMLKKGFQSLPRDR